MKKIASLVMTGLLLSTGFVHVSAQDSQLVDAAQNNGGTLTHNDLQFDKFSSCSDMTEVIEEFVRENIKDRPYPRYYEVEGMLDDVAMVESADSDTAAPSAAQHKTVRSESNEFSETNIQKDGVDEPDILKTDGTYLYYYNAKQSEISIMRGPLIMTTQTLDLDRVNILNTITVPERMSQVDLFLYEDTMIIVGQRHSQHHRPSSHFDRSTRTIIATYDISSVHDLELEHYQEIDGRRQDSRLNMDDGILYVVSQIQFNRWHGYPTGTTEVDVQVTKDSIMPKTLSVTKGSNGFDITTTSADCDDIHYLFPTKEQIEHMGSWPSFTVVTALDLDTYTKDTNIIFGQPSQIHMSQNSLYLAQGIYMPTQFSCPINARCAEPFFWGGQQHTLIHGFDIGGSRSLDYMGSNLVQGSPLGSQYSMDEYRGNFRILTQTWNNQSATHLYVLDDDLRVVGKLTDIEPGERFQGGRFMEDKLYMVTFRQIDPLFVIDLDDPRDPTIIGELKMPGYSNYLHPLGEEVGGKQYLVGLGYDTDINQRGGTRTSGVKIDIYLVDYDAHETSNSLCGSLDSGSTEHENCLDHVDTSRIYVEQLATKTLGQQGSYSPVLNNPRLFVMNSDHELTLPLLLKSVDTTQQRCNTVRDEHGNIIQEECRDIEDQVTTFVGLKSFALDTYAGTITETFSKDYLDLIKKSDTVYYNLYGHYLNQIGMRVGFLGDAKYMISNLFADFIVGNTNETVIFEDTLE